jgi:hypothetical protein
VHQKSLEDYFHCDMVNGTPLGWSFPIALTRQGESVPDPEKLAALIKKNRGAELIRTLQLLCRSGTWHYLAWLLKRTVESRLPGGRPFN